jgi:hypothetical protein
MTKLVLVVVDALKPAMLERAVADGRAPLFGEILRRGTYHSDCTSVFPSVTPAAAASITTGRLPDEHGVPSICWYHRGEGRYVDYGSSGAAVRTFGVLRTITDTVYNMNFDHLSRRTPTLFERLEDAGVRTACTPFLIYRGRTRHEMGLQGWMRRVAQAANLRQAVYGPSELFYGELYASKAVDCQASLARPGTRDPYSGCVGAYMERYDLYDFLLLSLPDNDHFSHNHGPQATVASIERADASLRQLAEAAGGEERFLRDHAVILMSDHAQIAVSRRANLVEVLSDWRVLQPNDPDPTGADLAVAPGARSAMVYALAEDAARERLRTRVLRRLRTVEPVDVLAWLENGEACVWSDRGELRFAPGTGIGDRRGMRWDLEGEPAALEAQTRDGMIESRTYPDALRRVWAALHCQGTGDILVSARREFEFADWGGSDHVGGGSHGSLRRGDSLASLAFLNCGPDSNREAGPAQWSITDVAGVVLDHFGVAA